MHKQKEASNSLGYTVCALLNPFLTFENWQMISFKFWSLSVHEYSFFFFSQCHLKASGMYWVASKHVLHEVDVVEAEQIVIAVCSVWGCLSAECQCWTVDSQKQLQWACKYQDWTAVAEGGLVWMYMCFFYIIWMTRCILIPYLRNQWHKGALWGEKGKPAEAENQTLGWRVIL